MVLEPNGFAGVGTLLAAVSRGTEAVAVLRHEYAYPHFAYAVDGTELTAFDPGRMDRVSGAEPGRLRAQLAEAGLVLIDPDAPDVNVDIAMEPVARAVVLAGIVTGVLPTLEALTGPMLSAQFEPWFTSAAPEGSALPTDPTSCGPHEVALVEAIAGASPAAKRAAAVAEVRRIADHLGGAGTPCLARTLADAEAGRFRQISVTSPLGREVRVWLRRWSTVRGSLNDSVESPGGEAVMVHSGEGGCCVC